MSRGPAYTPPLGFSLLTPLYDRAIALFTSEDKWRARLAASLDARPGETILDIGSGTGSLALIVTKAEPNCLYRGIDPDGAAVDRARSKAARTSSPAAFDVGFLPDRPDGDGQQVDKIVCSLVFHQTPMDEKRRLLRAMAAWLKPGGSLFLADYGEQRSAAMRLAFRCTVQLLDGKTDSAANAAGRIPALITEAFGSVASLARFTTPSGTIELWRADRPENAPAVSEGR